ncbi:hypothetical protein [Deinococcus soli (ex Cha et al. 2016)]|uniref:hypothetical protein n=1 Tax=Deinococcus soli (ex Cha et al. 2016) TaxID=1309411 RepID=UPI00166CDFCC|nr:hypothetical protein [Deinococcus soli (ex Cha et al. 2016)]GGB79277.1 hypothetical protein GCM10008019_39360 [Deinococcus soli (ex Cha et al. 2016)]
MTPQPDTPVTVSEAAWAWLTEHDPDWADELEAVARERGWPERTVRQQDYLRLCAVTATSIAEPRTARPVTDVSLPIDVFMVMFAFAAGVGLGIDVQHISTLTVRYPDSLVRSIELAVRAAAFGTCWLSGYALIWAAQSFPAGPLVRAGALFLVTAAAGHWLVRTVLH